MKRLARIFAVCVCVALLLSGIGLLLPGRALADANARDYIPAPAGILAVLIYYENVTAQNLYVRGSTGPHFGGTTNLGLSANEGVFRVIYYCDIPTPFGPMRASPQFLVPFGSVSLNTEAEQEITEVNSRMKAVTEEFAVGSNTASTGFGAPFILSQFWFLHDDNTKSYVGIAPYVYFPSGQYNDYKAVNVGAANWQFREELNGTQGFEVIPGHFAYIEATLGSDEFTNNYDYGPYRQTAVYAPTFTVESHLSYDLTKTVFAAADFYGRYAGNYRIDPLSYYDIPTAKVGATGESSVGGTLAYSFAPGFQLMLQYRADVAVANGPAENIFLLRFLWATDLNSLLGNPAAKQ